MFVECLNEVGVPVLVNINHVSYIHEASDKNYSIVYFNNVNYVKVKYSMNDWKLLLLIKEI